MVPYYPKRSNFNPEEAGNKLLRNAGIQPGILHSVTTQKTTTKINTTVKTSNSINILGVRPVQLSYYGNSFKIPLELNALNVGQYNDNQPL
jgi:hypothetical protein